MCKIFKKKFYIAYFFLFIGSSLIAGQINHLPFGIQSTCNQVLIKSAYVSCINYKTKNPDWVAYLITDELASEQRKRENKFFEDNEVKEPFRSKLSDYKGSGYDRGHLFPNALADYSIVSQRESFMLSNIAPQLPKFNRTVWKKLEQVVRQQLKKEKILNIFTGATYNYNTNKYIGNNVKIPNYFYKVIFAIESKKMYAFLIPHKELNNNDYKKFQVSVDMIEELTGNDFFYKLDDKIEDELESKITKL